MPGNTRIGLIGTLLLLLGVSLTAPPSNGVGGKEGTSIELGLVVAVITVGGEALVVEVAVEGGDDEEEEEEDEERDAVVMERDGGGPDGNGSNVGGGPPGTCSCCGTEGKDGAPLGCIKGGGPPKTLGTAERNG